MPTLLLLRLHKYEIREYVGGWISSTCPAVGPCALGPMDGYVLMGQLETETPSSLGSGLCGAALAPQP
jgi:hypothetical protein